MEIISVGITDGSERGLNGFVKGKIVYKAELILVTILSTTSIAICFINTSTGVGVITVGTTVSTTAIKIQLISLGLALLKA